MPLLGIPISQPCSCFVNNLVAFRSETQSGNKLVVGNDRGLASASAFSWKTLCIIKKVGKNFDLGRVEVWRGGLMINAVATLEISGVTHKNEGIKGYQNILRMDIDSVRSIPSSFESQSSSEDSTDVNGRERLRRMRISAANKGNIPWNKGRKHSPETLQRIKERTRLAMQDPKVKMKLAKLGHSQSEETRIKIGMGVRVGWERRREKLMLQETCHYEWQNLIAEAAQKGLFGEDELQWDSYVTLSKQLGREWLRSVKERKNTPRRKGSKRAPKSAEQKRKISEAISAKWADPGYRDRVCSGLAKFYGTSERVKRQPRRKPCGDGQAQKRSPTKKDETGNLEKREIKSQVRQVRLKRVGAPSYKDPFASTKLEMIKNIRTQRTTAVNKKSEAVTRAKLMIAEAEKAAAALEIAAQSSPHVQASLVESRMLIAEAIWLIGSIENGDPVSFESENYLSENSTETAPQDEEKMDPNYQTLDAVNHGKVNGVHSSSIRDIKVEDFNFNEFVLPDLVHGKFSNSCPNDVHETEQTFHQASFLPLDLNRKASHAKFDEHAEKPLVSGLEFQPKNTEAPKKDVKIIKKWVRGRLVEVVEET